MPQKKRRACSKRAYPDNQRQSVPASPPEPMPEKPETPQKPEKPERWWVTRLLDILKIVIGLANLFLGLFKH